MFNHFHCLGYPIWIKRRSSEQARAREAVCHKEESYRLPREGGENVVYFWRNPLARDKVMSSSRNLIQTGPLMSGLSGLYFSS